MRIKRIFEFNLFERIYFIILCLNVLLLNIFVGSTLRDPRFVLQALIMLETLIYIPIQKLNKKTNILIKSKIDIFILLFTISTSLPLLFKTSVSQYYTINMFLVQLTVYCMYILVRNVITTPKRKNILINVTLISSVLIVIFGLDELYFDTFRPFLKVIYSAESDAYGMVSTLGYSNAVASYMTFMLFLALGQYLTKQNKWQKSLYAVSMQISMLGIYFGNSRAGMLIFVILFIPYLIKLKEPNSRIMAVFQIILTFACSFIFEKITGIYTNTWLLWIQFIGLLILSYLINYIIEMINLKNIYQNLKEKIKINKKYITVLAILIIIIVIAFIKIASKYSKPIVIGKDKYIIDIEGGIIEPNTHHKIKIEYEAKVKESQASIDIYEINQYRRENLIGTRYIKDGQNTDTIEVLTSGTDIECGRIYINLKDGEQMTINKIYVDGEEYIDNYKYVPNSIMRLVKTLSFKDISVSERVIMYRNGLKLIKRSPIIGSGGKAFSCLYETVKSYNYWTFENHSYIIDTLVNYGIFGLMCYVIIIAITIKNYLDNKTTTLNLSIFMAFLFVTIHTMFDFDLSYMVTMVNYFIFIAILNENDKNIQARKSDNFFSIALCIALIALTISNFRCAYGNYMYQKEDYESAIKYYPYSKNLKENLIISNNKNNELIKNYLKTEKNSEQTWMCDLLYKNIKENYNGNLEEVMNTLEIIYDELVNNSRLERYNVPSIVDRGILIESICNFLDNINDNNSKITSMIVGNAQKFVNDYDEEIEQMNDLDKNSYRKDKIEEQLERYEKIYNQMNTYIDKY